MSRGKLNYVSPVITAIELNPQQAVLAQCSRTSGSKYDFDRGWCNYGSMGSFGCATVRGGASVAKDTRELSDVPS